ncbi:MAG: hypothetical protein DMF77_13340 [Acidobacteria bacterium]|nr:MAG: hypothetical protein DMF77_13340 [Acidobacteriota bacterium]
MRAARERSAGFTLIEVMIVMAITLVIGAVVYEVTRSSWLLYRVQTHVTERGFSGVRAVDDMSVEIARAGFGLGRDAGPLFPGTLEGVRGRTSSKGISSWPSTRRRSSRRGTWSCSSTRSARSSAPRSRGSDPDRWPCARWTAPTDGSSMLS